MKPVNFGAVDAHDDLRAMEALAVELAALAGREIVATFGTIFQVRYKTGARDRSACAIRCPRSTDGWKS